MQEKEKKKSSSCLRCCFSKKRKNANTKGNIANNQTNPPEDFQTPDWPRFKFYTEGFPGHQMFLVHITNYKAGQSILCSGIMYPGKKGWFGPGIYFAPSKEEALEKTIGGKGEDKFMITAKVNLGKTMKIASVYDDPYREDFHHIDFGKLKKKGYNSVHASTRTGDEYIAYRPEDVKVYCGEDLRKIAQDKKKINEFIKTLKKNIDDINQKLEIENKKISDLQDAQQKDENISELIIEKAKERSANYDIAYDINEHRDSLINNLKNPPIQKWPRFKYTTEGFLGHQMFLVHITNYKAGQSILNSGIMYPGKRGWFGAGIYFASTKEEALKKTIGGQGEDKYMITAKVNLGRAMRLDFFSVYNDKYRNDFHYIDYEDLQKIDCCSVHSSTKTGDEYVVYRPEDVKIYCGEDLRPIAKDEKKIDEYVENLKKSFEDINQKLEEENKKAISPPQDAYQIDDNLCEMIIERAQERNVKYGIAYDINQKKSIPLPRFQYSLEGFNGRKKFLAHLTNHDAGISIVKSGIMKPEAHGWLGGGIYFAETKEECLAKTQNGADYLIVVKVNLDKSMAIKDVYNDKYKNEFHSINHETLSYLGCNSLIAKTNSGKEYVVYRSKDVDLDSYLCLDLSEIPQASLIALLIRIENIMMEATVILEQEEQEELEEKDEQEENEEGKKSEIQKPYSNFNELSSFKKESKFKQYLEEEFLKLSKDFELDKHKHKDSESQKLNIKKDEFKPKFKYQLINRKEKYTILHFLTSETIAFSVLSNNFFPTTNKGFGEGIYFSKTKEECFEKIQKNNANYLISIKVELNKMMLISDPQNDAFKIEFSSIDKVLLNNLGCNVVIFDNLIGKEYVIYEQEKIEILGSLDLRNFKNDSSILNALYIIEELSKKDINNFTQNLKSSLENFHSSYPWENENLTDEKVQISKIYTEKINKSSKNTNNYENEQPQSPVMNALNYYVGVPLPPVLKDLTSLYEIGFDVNIQENLNKTFQNEWNIEDI